MRCLVLLWSVFFGIISSQAHPPEFEELVRGTYAIHLTRVFPKDGLMIPGSLFSVSAKKIPPSPSEEINEKEALNKEKDSIEASSETQRLLTLEQRLELAKIVPKHRFTLHWALSGVAEDHTFSTDDGEILNVDRLSCPFAILEPLEYLLPESYGGHDQDWITVGPHKLSSNAILLASISQDQDLSSFPGKVTRFDPTTQNLEEIVTQTLQGLNGFILKRDIPVKDYDVDVTLENVKEMADVDSPTLATFFEPAESQKQRVAKLMRKVQEAPGQKWRITRYNEDNVPVTVYRHTPDSKMHFKSPQEFYTSLRERGYFWGKHQFTPFAKFESFLKGLFSRVIAFQASQLISDMGSVEMPGFKVSGSDPSVYALNSIADFKAFILGTKLGPTSQEAFNLWLKELGIWIKYVCQKDNMQSLDFLTSIEQNHKVYLKRVVDTVDLHSVKPMMKLY